MKKSVLLFVSLWLTTLTSCTEQHNPFAFWRWFSKERTAAKKSIEETVETDNNQVKKLDDSGKLVVEEVKKPASTDPTEATLVDNNAKKVINADKIYSEKCALCHGENGQAGLAGARKFVGKWQKEASDEQIIAAITYGTGGIMTRPELAELYKKIQKQESFVPYTMAMVAFEDQLSKEEIEALVPKIRSFAKQ